MLGENIQRVLTRDVFTKHMYKGVFSRDLIPRVLNSPYCIVINTDLSTGRGIHWVAVYGDEHSVEFFDSFGFPPEQYEIKIGCDLTNQKILQCTNSQTCGYYCLYYLLFRCRGYPMSQIISWFTNDCTYNDILVKDFISFTF